MIFETDILMWYEEFNWAIMFILNTGISIYFFLSGDLQSSSDPRFKCVYISLLFGAIYLPFQILGHLPHIDSEERRAQRKLEKIDISFRQAKKGCWRVLTHRVPSTKYSDWGGAVGSFWMFGYWILEPFWPLLIAYSYSLQLRGK